MWVRSCGVWLGGLGAVACTRQSTTRVLLQHNRRLLQYNPCLLRYNLNPLTPCGLHTLPETRQLCHAQLRQECQAMQLRRPPPPPPALKCDTC